MTTASERPSDASDDTSPPEPSTTCGDPKPRPDFEAGLRESEHGDCVITRTGRRDIRTSAALSVNSEHDADQQCVRPVGELDIATAPMLERELDAAASSDAKEIVVDLSQLTFMDSSGIHVLLRANETWGARDRRLSIITGAPLIDRLFDLAPVRGLLPIVRRDDGQPTDY